ncbi:MAG: universal stress protein [Pseudomonadota bacterium]
MSQYRHILVITSPDMQHTPALRRAAALARKTGAHLELCLFDYHLGIAAVGVLQPLVMDLAQGAFASQREGWLRDTALDLSESGLSTSFKFVWSESIIDAIVSRLLHAHYDLVVKDLGPTSALRLGQLSALDRALVRLCPVPLLMVQEGPESRHPRLLAAVDPAHDTEDPKGLNQRIVQAALALAYQCDGTVHLGHSFAGLPLLTTVDSWSTGIEFTQSYDLLRNRQQEAFDAMAESLGVAKELRHSLCGEPSSEMPALANLIGASTLVVGSTYRHGLDRWLVGSTAEDILDTASGDVLVVKPDGFLRVLAAHYGLPSTPNLPQAA